MSNYLTLPSHTAPHGLPCPFSSRLPRRPAGEWQGSFLFVQGADPQLGLMKEWESGVVSAAGGDEWAEELRLARAAVAAVNRMRPRPRFLVLCGDLVHAMPGQANRAAQEEDLRAALCELDPAIPLVLLPGNHDIGNAPTAATVEAYRRSWGDDYFAFWAGGARFLVLNSQLFVDASLCPELAEEQERWLEEQLESYKAEGPRGPLVILQHTPLFLVAPDEDDDYFNVERHARRRLLDKFSAAGVCAVFTGHYHRNAGGRCGAVEVVVSSAIGCQIGSDVSGLRVVTVTEAGVRHRYYGMDQVPECVELDVEQ
ncbi:serine/threonine-protein phosphatase CPPED1 isoform X4 [Lethenteron reissneri]|uniref:serine/threonine-protein phosphatase CPPED1 isoform X4 n=1 Tax=Lethenteron reissneri TaxID=7753 RepID=UPI002AB644E0|nr:serine/threonine-protein phosphatase CPPED1 isoform X4 [Lethenteron reissneri]